MNSPAFDWGFIAAGAYYYGWQKGKHFFNVDGYDGDVLGYERFYTFSCHRAASAAYCHNAFGDAIRYRR